MVAPDYTREELELLISRITILTLMPVYMRAVLKNKGPSGLKEWMHREKIIWCSLMYNTPYEKLPLLINSRCYSNNQMTIIKWRLEIGK